MLLRNGGPGTVSIKIKLQDMPAGLNWENPFWNRNAVFWNVHSIRFMKRSYVRRAGALIIAGSEEIWTRAG